WEGANSPRLSSPEPRRHRLNYAAVMHPPAAARRYKLLMLGESLGARRAISLICGEDWAFSMTPEECSAARERLGWTTHRMASIAGLAERTIIRFEAGEATPRPGTLIALRRALRSAQEPVTA